MDNQHKVGDSLPTPTNFTEQVEELRTEFTSVQAEEVVLQDRYVAALQADDRRALRPQGRLSTATRNDSLRSRL